MGENGELDLEIDGGDQPAQTNADSFKTKREQLAALQNKIQELRMKQLLSIEYLEAETRKIVGKMAELEKKGADITKKLEEGNMEIKIGYCILASIKVQIEALGGWKMALKECRLGAVLLIKEEARINCEVLKVSGEK